MNNSDEAIVDIEQGVRRSSCTSPLDNGRNSLDSAVASEEEEEEEEEERSQRQLTTTSDLSTVVDQFTVLREGDDTNSTKDDALINNERNETNEESDYVTHSSLITIDSIVNEEDKYDQGESQQLSLEEEFTRASWWDTTKMRGEDDVHVNIPDDEQETVISNPDDIEYEEDEDWFDRKVNENTITGIRLPVVVQDVSYEVKHKTQKGVMIKLLSDVGVVFQPCRVTALMGPSGAGKTTLLDVIAGRKTQGKMTGQILVGEQKSSSKVLKSCAAYVEQFDNLLPTLTVKETLLYAAELKRPNIGKMKDPIALRKAAEQRVRDVNQLIKTLQLQSCENTVVGSNLERGISGGQAKRVNIGIALVTKPRILFLDEPTSGLDSETSCGIVKACRDLADGGVNVIATIHSPSAAAFQLFDNLVMMKKGSVTYAGTLFGSNGAESYFYDMGFFCEPTLNFADFLVSTNATDEQDFVAKFKSSFHAKHNRDLVAASITNALSFKTASAAAPASSTTKRDSTTSSSSSEEDGGKKYEGVPEHKPIGPIAAAKTLLRYRAYCNFRDKNFMGARIVGHLIFSIVMASMYWKQGDESAYDTNAAQNVANLLFMNNVLPAFASAAYMPSILMERGLFYRELDDGCYTVWSYGLYKIIEEVCVALPVSMVAQLIVHFGCALKGSFFVDWMVYFAVGQSGAALAYVVASASKNIDVANAALPVYNVLQILFSGLLMREQQIPTAWQWWPPTLFVRYGWKAQMINHFSAIDTSPVYYDKNGQKTLSATEYYDADGSVALNLSIVAFICFWWMLMAGAVMSTIRHQNR